VQVEYKSKINFDFVEAPPALAARLCLRPLKNAGLQKTAASEVFSHWRQPVSNS
jgi:hypothetical protein